MRRSTIRFLRDITLVMQDWGGLIGGGFALHHADRIKRLCFINTTAPLGLPIEQEIFPKTWARFTRMVLATSGPAKLEYFADHCPDFLLSRS